MLGFADSARAPAMPAVHTAAPIAPAGDNHLPETRLQAPCTAFAVVRPRHAIGADHALAYRLLSTPLIEVPLDQAAQQLASLHLHHGFQLTVGRSLSFLAYEFAQQLLKLRQRIRVMLDRCGRDRIRFHRRGLLG